MWEDPIVTEVRKVREQLAKKFNFDLHAIFEDLRKSQISSGSRLVRLQKKMKSEQVAVPGEGSFTLHPGR